MQTKEDKCLKNYERWENKRGKNELWKEERKKGKVRLKEDKFETDTERGENKTWKIRRLVGGEKIET